MERGKVWFNGDGTVTNPDGSVVPDKKRKLDSEDSHSVKFAMAADVNPEECLFELESDEELHEIKLSVEEIEMPTDIDYAVIAEVMIASNEAETAIIDTGCATAVGGSKWIASYIKTLDPDDKKHARSIQSKAKFKFGDGKVYKSKCKHICPIYLGGRRKFIIFDEVNCDIPLLISLELVKKSTIQQSFPGGPSSG